jgi:hypothetical protein
MAEGGAIVAHSEEISRRVDSTKLRVAWLKDGGGAMRTTSGGATFQLKIYFEGDAELRVYPMDLGRRVRHE